jgi:branched-chain amino acid transport system permease protein
MNSKSEILPILAFFAILAAVAFAMSGNNYMLHIAILILIWSVVVVCWDLVMGYAGILSYGQLAFFAIGGYTSGLMSTRLGLDPLAGMLAGGILAGIVGGAVAVVALRLDPVFMALVTFALHLSLSPILVAGRAFGTGGTQGILGIPPITLAGYTFGTVDKLPWFLGAFALAAITILVVFRVIHSPLGFAFKALRDGPVQARSIGINAFHYKAVVFMLAAALTGVAGGYYAHYSGSISPRILSLDTFLLVFGMLIVGGRGRLTGALFGVVIVTVLNEALRSSGEIRPLALGLLVVAIVMFVPKGVMDLARLLPRRTAGQTGC